MTETLLPADRIAPPDGARPPVLRSRAARLLRGPVGDPGWARPALLALLAGTALLYLWDLGASGTANSFYAAAVQAGTQSWKAMLFGSLDAGNAITVDKPAMFLWPMEISGRLFGFTGWSMLAPQALEGVAAVALLAATVRRATGSTGRASSAAHVAGLLAGATLALTPVAVLMFKFNNPDALLTLLLTAAGYTTVRALTSPRHQWWLTGAGTLIGLAFITKMGQALLLAPALGATYLLAGHPTLRHRITDLLGAGLAMVAAAGWYIALVDLWPATSRPYIGGSTDNSLLELALGYNGLGRLLGNTTGNGGAPGGGGGPGGSTAFGGATGITRMLSGDFATEVSWLLPTALLALLAGLWLTRRAPRTDPTRAALVLFGGWSLVTGLVFSYMQGTIHPYYAVALAPGIAGTIGTTASLLWQTRTRTVTRALAAALVAVTALWDAHLLGLTPAYLPSLRSLVLLGAAIAVIGLLAVPPRRQVLVAAAAVAGVTVLSTSAAYALSTTTRPHTGSIPSAGPTTSAFGGPGGGFGGGAEPSADTALTAVLKATTTRWAAAAIGSQSAAPLQLASGRPVLSIGGFTGGDPAPTLAQFQAYVAGGQVRYFLAGGGFGGGRGGPGGGSAISTWVAGHYTATTVGGTTVYDLTAPNSAGTR